MAVGTYLGPKRVVIAFAEGAQQAGQPDEGEIEPAEALAIGGMAELMLANWVGEDKALPFATHPWHRPQVDESAQRHAHEVGARRLRRKGDAAQGIDTVNLSRQGPSHRKEPSHEGLRQLPSEPGEQLPHTAPWRPVGVGQEKAPGELGGDFETF